MLFYNISNQINDHLQYAWELFDTLDINYWKWVLWVVYPIIISFLLPLIILLFLYGSALFLNVYHYRRRLREAYGRDFWDGARKTLAALWDGQARLWHGYEIVGFDKIPREGPALLIYYHGTIPIDFYYVIAKTLLDKNRHIRAVGDRFLFHIPGWRLMMEVMRVTPGTVQSCVNVLREGHLLGIAPGGVREALFGDEHYQLMWGRRDGYAKVAIQANVPVIPLFTQNVREAFRTPVFGRNLLLKLYEKTRLPISLIYGFFPVKMRTFVGDPIYPDQTQSVDQFKRRVESALHLMIHQNQRLPGNIFMALLDRLIPHKPRTRLS
ncbi:transmembrane protein 68-like [Mizuhopecten yessoensis]|uniref:Transmembrane protein 68 n=1 Tax=Mizuhopecten yessoensis TaxID=6573 RepID=A0A210Q7R7_MIZYE|nr:transmembrane protein 68-like [Mizuhopecten yessoensis]XP_021365040.1 transmembrane protein 68-like [Mizuhopecten yessoensis]OWF44773.1 Transmembrane protein 68 [Mizuhopecten yessoensis]